MNGWEFREWRLGRRVSLNVVSLMIVVFFRIEGKFWMAMEYRNYVLYTIRSTSKEGFIKAPIK